MPTARGFHRTNPGERVSRAGGAGDGVRIIVHRYGQPVAHLWGRDWLPLNPTESNPRRWAQIVYVAVNGRWIDADTGMSGPSWDPDDRGGRPHAVDAGPCGCVQPQSGPVDLMDSSGMHQRCIYSNGSRGRDQAGQPADGRNS